MPLPLAPIGERLTVKKVLAEERYRRHFHDLGIAAGAAMMLLSVTGGNVIVQVHGSRLALDKHMAMKIIVG